MQRRVAMATSAKTPDLGGFRARERREDNDVRGTDEMRAACRMRQNREDENKQKQQTNKPYCPLGGSRCWFPDLWVLNVVRSL